jgi:hypothetical protein
MSDMTLCGWQNLLAALRNLIDNYGLDALIEAIDYLRITK